VKLWIDAQLSPALARWITDHFEGLEAAAVRELGLRDVEDAEIFEAARQAKAVVMSKDSDFVDLVNRLGPPPQVLWIRCGNTSNAQMRLILSSTLAAAVDLLNKGEALVELSGQ
jgi:predicted nuclease of predicted toxin-antitoxin system